MKNKKTLSICILILMTFFTIISFKNVFNNINYGLDLKGGFEVLYKVESLDGKEISNDELISTYKAINNRIDTLGVSEPVISIENDKIRVQLPGVTDEKEARKRLSTPAVLTFRNSLDEELMNSNILNTPGSSLDYDNLGKPVVALNIKDNDTFYKVTKQVSESIDQLIVIWLDFDENIDSYESQKETCGQNGELNCISSAVVKEAFTGNVIIEGNFTKEEAENLVDLINSGSLPTKLTEISTKSVDANTGIDTLKIAGISGIITLVVITIIMSIFYKLSGFISSICLLTYSLIVFAIFNMIDGVLTLTGIAALILGIGIAIDSSVVQLEKIKDEIRAGKKLKNAFKEANKRSLVSIIDANITTLIVAFILFIFGESTVKGFGSVLIITIIVTLITMVFINRYVLSGFVNDKTNINIFIGKVKPLKERNIFNHSKKVITTIIIVLTLGILFAFINKINFGIDFKGGTNITLKSNEIINEKQIKEILKDYEINTEYKNDKHNFEYIIKNTLLDNDINNLKEQFEEINITSDFSVISNVVKKDLTVNAIKAILIALVCILIYISIRFTYNYALSSLIALFIDISLIFTFFIIFKIEINFIFIASILTIIGYSINDTIVLFDLIREKKKNDHKMDNKNIANICMIKAVKRSILTSLTTIVPILCLLILGADGIKEFNIAILIGLIVGTFTSLFVAPFIWSKLETRSETRPKKIYDDGPEEKIIKGINS